MVNLSFLENELFIILLATGVSIWLIGLYVMKHQPKSPNRTYGYRTPQSMKSQEAWDYAQIHGTKRMIKGAQQMCLLALLSLFFQPSEGVGVFIALVLVLALLFFPLLKTERELKDKF